MVGLIVDDCRCLLIGLVCLCSYAVLVVLMFVCVCESCVVDWWLRLNLCFLVGDFV